MINLCELSDSKVYWTRFPVNTETLLTERRDVGVGTPALYSGRDSTKFDFRPEKRPS